MRERMELLALPPEEAQRRVSLNLTAPLIDLTRIFHARVFTAAACAKLKVRRLTLAAAPTTFLPATCGGGDFALGKAVLGRGGIVCRQAPPERGARRAGLGGF
jgi:hypothetical protein